LKFFSGKKDISNDESAANFIARRFGEELLKRAGEPLIGSIYMADVNQLSASQLYRISQL